MKKRPSLLVAVVFVLSAMLLLAPAYAKYDTLSASKIDLQQTEEYLANWLDSDQFPESVTLAYYYVYSLPALGGAISSDAKKQLVDFIKLCQKDNGGFADKPGKDHDARLVFTYHALKSLYLLDSLADIDRKAAKRYVLSLVQDNGGMTESWASRKTTLTATYYGVQSLRILRSLKALDKNKTAAFLKGYLTSDKGFSGAPNGKPTPKATNMGIVALASLDRLTDDIKNGASSFLTETYPPEFFNGESSIQELANVLKTLDHLSMLDEADSVKMYERIKSLYSQKNGGFGRAPGLGVTPASTYHGIVCLVELGKLQDPQIQLLIARKPIGRLFYQLLITQGLRSQIVF